MGTFITHPIAPVGSSRGPCDRFRPHSTADRPFLLCFQSSIHTQSFFREALFMLEQMRKSSQSLLIYVLFGIVIAVFIINFGPQSKGGCDGPSTDSDQFAARVAGDTISSSAFRYGFLVLGGAQYPPQIAKQQRLKETVMDKLIERELLAQEAERLGYAVTEEEV